MLLSDFQVAVAIQETDSALDSSALLRVALSSSVANMLCLCAVCLSIAVTSSTRSGGNGGTVFDPRAENL
jgi:hypothetical protein